MITKTSQFIAVLFHPLFIVLYSYLIYFNISSTYNQMLFLAAPKVYWPLFSFLVLMTVFFPLITILIMYKNKLITSINMPQRKERIPVLILMLIYYSMTYYIFRYWNATLLNLLSPYLSFLFGGLLLLITLSIITLRWKISFHSASISGLCGGMIAETLVSQGAINLSQVLFFNTLLILFIGVVSFTRIFLKAHKVYEVVSGIIVGFTLMFYIVFEQIFF